MNRYNPSKNCFEIIKGFEKLSLVAYPDPATKNDPVKKGEPWTIGWGTTVYPDGRKVKKGDVCNAAQAEYYLMHDVQKFSADVNKLIGDTQLKQQQFDALVSFAYNVGSDIDADDIAEGLGDSTLLKKVLANPNDPTIKDEFLKWVKANGRKMNGLVTRRANESHVYFS